MGEPDFKRIHDNDEEVIEVGRRRQGMRGRLYRECMKRLRKFPNATKDIPTNCISSYDGESSLFIWVREGKTEFIVSHDDTQRVYDVPKDCRKGIPDKYLKPLVEAFLKCCEVEDGKEAGRKRRASKRRKTDEAGADT